MRIFVNFYYSPMYSVFIVRPMMDFRKLTDYLLWGSYQRSEWWIVVVAKRVSFMGWFLIAIIAISSFFGTDMLSNGLGFLACFGVVVLFVEVCSLLFRKSPVEVSSIPQGLVYAGAEGIISLNVKALEKVKRMRVALYPWKAGVKFQEFRECREPLEEKRNIFDRKMKFYRWKWLNEKRSFLAKESPQLKMEKGEVQKISLPTIFYKRGAWELTDARAKLAGIFGLLERSRKTVGKRTIMYVAPKVTPVTFNPTFGMQSSQEDHLETTQRVGESQEFLSLREYKPGDSWSKVNWKAMARTDKMMVQENEAFSVPRYTLLWNTTGMDLEEFETAASAVTSLMLTLSDRGESGQVVIDHGGQRSYDWSLDREALLRVLAEIQPKERWIDDEQTTLEGMVYIIAKETQKYAEAESVKISGNCVNGIPVEEGITL